MNSLSYLFPLVLLVCVIPQGHTLKCYTYMCTNVTMNGKKVSTPCSDPHKEVTCGEMFSMPSDGCMTQRTEMSKNESGVIEDISIEVRNCSVNAVCPSMCSQVPKDYKCKVSCCKGDLCNDGRPHPTLPPQPKPTGPVGKDLTCYTCGAQPGEPGPHCDKPSKMTCGIDQMGKPQDQCNTIKMKSKAPGGKIVEFEQRNCTSSFFCNQKMICAAINSTGNAVDCKLTCCSGNLCNTDAFATTTPTPIPTVPSDGVKTAASVAMVILAAFALIGRV